MQFIKRFGLLIVVNLLIMLTLTTAYSVACAFFPQLRYSSLTSLAIYSGIWGFGGALISLFMSKTMAKWFHGVEIIDPKSTQFTHRMIVETTQRLAKKAGLPKTPEVGIFESPDINAFATGPTKSNSLVAVSSGLLSRMSPDEIEGVLAHEVAHIANGDMVTMTLLQGITNAFAIFFSRIIGSIAANAAEEKNRYWVRSVVTIVCQIIFTVLGSIVVAFFSRLREYRADSGGAYLAGKDKMIAALTKLNIAYRDTVYEDENDNQNSTQTLMISSRRKSMMNLFMTHPPLDDRIQALRNGIPSL